MASSTALQMFANAIKARADTKSKAAEAALKARAEVQKAQLEAQRAASKAQLDVRKTLEDTIAKRVEDFAKAREAEAKTDTTAKDVSNLRQFGLKDDLTQQGNALSQATNDVTQLLESLSGGVAARSFGQQPLPQAPPTTTTTQVQNRPGIVQGGTFRFPTRETTVTRTTTPNVISPAQVEQLRIQRADAVNRVATRAAQLAINRASAVEANQVNAAQVRLEAIRTGAQVSESQAREIASLARARADLGLSRLYEAQRQAALADAGILGARTAPLEALIAGPSILDPDSPSGLIQLSPNDVRLSSQRVINSEGEVREDVTGMDFYQGIGLPLLTQGFLPVLNETGLRLPGLGRVTGKVDIGQRPVGDIVERYGKYLGLVETSEKDRRAATRDLQKWGYLDDTGNLPQEGLMTALAPLVASATTRAARLPSQINPDNRTVLGDHFNTGAVFLPDEAAARQRATALERTPGPSPAIAGASALVPQTSGERETPGVFRAAFNILSQPYVPFSETGGPLVEALSTRARQAGQIGGRVLRESVRPPSTPAEFLLGPLGHPAIKESLSESFRRSIEQGQARRQSLAEAGRVGLEARRQLLGERLGTPFTSPGGAFTPEGFQRASEQSLELSRRLFGQPIVPATREALATAKSVAAGALERFFQIFESEETQ